MCHAIDFYAAVFHPSSLVWIHLSVIQEWKKMLWNLEKASFWLVLIGRRWKEKENGCVLRTLLSFFHWNYQESPCVFTVTLVEMQSSIFFSILADKTSVKNTQISLWCVSIKIYPNHFYVFGNCSEEHWGIFSFPADENKEQMWWVGVEKQRSVDHQSTFTQSKNAESVYIKIMCVH